MTLRQLPNHTSGLPDHPESPEFRRIVLADPRHHFDSRRLLDHVAGRPLAFRPGSRYHYSYSYSYSYSDNIAVALMAEAATGTPYENRMSVPYLHGYNVSPPGPPEDVSEVLSASGAWASGGIVSSPADLTRFVRGYAGGALSGKSVVREQRRWRPGASEPAGPAGPGVTRPGPPP